MNSWKSTVLVECAPPLRTFIIGVGRTWAFGPPRYWYNGRPTSSAAARAAAKETPKIALAPNLPLFGVPSRSIMVWSIRRCSVTSRPITALAISLFTWPTAFKTPLPPKRSLSPSRSSTASCSPVEAPDGTNARPKPPSSVYNSTSTVGLPRESKTSRANTSVMIDINSSPFCQKAV